MSTISRFETYRITVYMSSAVKILLKAYVLFISVLRYIIKYVYI